MAHRMLVVDAGDVGCPESGRVDVERCLACPQFRRLRLRDSDGAPCVECRPPRAPLSRTWDDYATLTGHLPG